jgi:peroxiredoxin family protein
MGSLPGPGGPKGAKTKQVSTKLGGSVERVSDKGHLSIIAFSGTVDRLYPVAILSSGAVMNDMRVDIFFTFWGLMALQKGKAAENLRTAVSQDYGPLGESFLRVAEEKNLPGWQAMLAQARELGDVHIKACAMSMDLFGLTLEDLDPMVEEVAGVGEFVDAAKDGMTLVF